MFTHQGKSLQADRPVTERGAFGAARHDADVLSHTLSLQRAFDAGDGAPAHPDFVGFVESYLHAPVAANAAALLSHVGVPINQPFAPHERRHAPVTAPAHGVFGYPLRGGERAHFELSLPALRLKAEDRHTDDAPRCGR